MTKRVLVTGAGGFIGSHLTEALAHDGWQVRAMVRYTSRGRAGWLDDGEASRNPAVEIAAGDIRDQAFVRSCVKDCDVVMNLAALVGIPYSYVAPSQYVETNIMGTLNVLLAARDFGTGMVIQTSTSEVYGSAQTVPISETHPVVGQSPYSASKIGADQLALSFYRSFGTPVAVIRPFNTYGPRQSSRAVIPTIITQLLSGSRQIALGSLEPTRDFNFIADTVRAFVMLAESQTCTGEVINIGSGFEISIGETLKIISDVMGVKATAHKEPKRIRPAASEVGRLLADNSKATRLLGWTPQFGGREGFARGIERTVEWFRTRVPQADTTRYAV